MVALAAQPINEKKVLSMIVNSWSEDFKKRYGVDLPTDYCSWDLETTGFSKTDLIVEIGHCIAHDGQAVHRMNAVLDWTKHEYVDQKWLKERLEYVRKQVEFDKDGKPTGKKYHMTYDRMAAEGQPPEEVLEFYFNLFWKMRQNDGFWIGQNLLSFDERVFNQHLQEFVGYEWKFEQDEVFDVGAIFKATNLTLLPYKDESLRKYFTRVNQASGKGLKWNIEACMEHYKLRDKYAEHLAGGECHTAGFDCYVCQLIFEEQRRLVKGAPRNNARSSKEVQS